MVGAQHALGTASGFIKCTCQGGAAGRGMSTLASQDPLALAPRSCLPLEPPFSSQERRHVHMCPTLPSLTPPPQALRAPPGHPPAPCHVHSPQTLLVPKQGAPGDRSLCLVPLKHWPSGVPSTPPSSLCCCNVPDAVLSACTVHALPPPRLWELRVVGQPAKPRILGSPWVFSTIVSQSTFLPS